MLLDYNLSVNIISDGANLGRHPPSPQRYSLFFTNIWPIYTKNQSETSYFSPQLIYPRKSAQTTL